MLAGQTLGAGSQAGRFAGVNAKISISMYQHGRRTKRPLNTVLFFGTLVVIGIVVLLSWLMVRRDIANTTDPKSTVPIVTEIGDDKEATVRLDEPLFTMELPADWTLLERRNEDYINAYIWRSTKKGADDRKLTLHINIMPAEHKLVRMQPLTVNGDKFMLGNVSDDCVNFAGGAGRTQASPSGNAPFEAKWENVTFMCDPITTNQTIGTGTVEGGIAARAGRSTFFFFYEDHNIKPDNTILRRALESFRAK